MCSEETAMAHPYHHSLSSIPSGGGTVDDYLPIHSCSTPANRSPRFPTRAAATPRRRHLHGRDTLRSDHHVVDGPRHSTAGSASSTSSRISASFRPSRLVKCIRPEPRMGRTGASSARWSGHLPNREHGGRLRCTAPICGSISPCMTVGGCRSRSVPQLTRRALRDPSTRGAQTVLPADARLSLPVAGNRDDLAALTRNPRSHRTVLFRAADFGGFYRISNVKKHSYRLIDPA